ncbi:MAG TPA: hypothetical protein VFO73_12040 [Candidatus Limnocylindrales bacterium]|nr:hypothetical protein [Candidatus Limnocylindrales bacterium]
MSDGPLERLARAAEEAVGDDPRPATFARGLAIGALVGAAIAGSTIWQRRHARTAATASRSEPESPAAAGSRDTRETSASD